MKKSQSNPYLQAHLEYRKVVIKLLRFDSELRTKWEVHIANEDGLDMDFVYIAETQAIHAFRLAIIKFLAL